MRPFVRGKRLRLVFILPIILIAQAFWYASMGSDAPDAESTNIMLPMAIMALPIMALQLTFALEGNYFDGLLDTTYKHSSAVVPQILHSYTALAR